MRYALQRVQEPLALGREHVAADQLGRLHPEQAAGGAVGSDDPEACRLDQAYRLEHRLDQRRPGAARRVGNVEQIDRQRVVHSSSSAAFDASK